MANLQKQFKKYDSKIEKSVPQYSALLGKTKNIVRHPTRNGFCYARMADNLNELITVFNDKVSEVYNLPVKIERVGNNWHVVGRDTQRYPDWATQSSFVPSHHFQHEFNRDVGGGAGDVVFTYPDQFTPLLCYPYQTGSSGVMISPYLMQTASNFMYVGNTGSPDILANKPTDDQANVGLIYLDKTTGNPGLVMGGSSFPATVTGTSALAPYFPFPTTTQEPLYFVRMVSGTTSIEWENLYNARQFIGGSSGGGGSTAPVTDANNDFQVGISGSWVKKTLGETQTILEVIPEAPLDYNYYGRQAGSWENITTYTDTLYLPLSDMSSSEATELTDGTGSVTTLHTHSYNNITDAPIIKETLTAARTYYVRTDGNDANTGLANTSGGAFLSIQKAIDTTSGTLDMSIYAVTIQITAGTYAGAVTCKQCVGAGTVIIVGDETTAANVIISAAVGVSSSGISTLYSVRGVKFTSTAISIFVTSGAAVEFQNINCGGGGQHLRCADNGVLTATGDYTISANGDHWVAVGGGVIRVQNRIVTLIGALAFGIFCNETCGGVVFCNGSSFPGLAATGIKYYVQLNSVCYTAGAGINFIPGTTGSGVTATGGQYV